MATIIIKPTKKCNSNCSYCIVLEEEKKMPSMPLILLESIFIKINEFLKIRPRERVVINWHGGEPLLLGENYFKQIIEFQKKHCSETRDRLSHSIQSNLTLMNDNFAEIFRQLGINTVGTSYEPIINIRGFGNDHNSEKYNKLFFKGIKILEKNSLSWAFIYVVNKKSLERPQDIFYIMSNMRLKGTFNINPMVNNGKNDDELGINQQEFADFLGEVFKTWWKHRDRYPQVNPFIKYYETFIKKRYTLDCEDTGKCTYERICIGSNGETYLCSRASDLRVTSYGNIKERSILDIIEDKKREQFINRINTLQEGECKGCKFWEYCHGGCPMDSYVIYKDFNHRSYKCEIKKIFFEKYFIPITGVRI